MILLMFIQADILACTVGSDLKLDISATSNDILLKAGKKLQYELNKKYPSLGMKPGEIARLQSGGSLLCNYVLIGVLPFLRGSGGTNKYEFTKQVGFVVPN